ncbi:glycosyltransferase family 4 protein [Candidatus Dependentiae bacterium]|nr:glycosyltransferase family 4 protein [Candidatus Dependentiae bacterium]
MKICLDLLPIPEEYGGSGRYALNLIKGFSELYGLYPNKYIIYLNSIIKKHVSIDNNNFIINSRSFKSKIARIRFEQNKLVKLVNTEEFDVFHAIANILPLKINAEKTKLIATVHDLLFLKNPTRYPITKYQYYKHYVSKTISISHKIIVDSEYTKNDIETYFPEEKEKVRVIPLAPDPTFRPDGDNVQTEDFILTVAALEPGKGFEDLLTALEQTFRERKIKLFIAGPKGWKNKKIMKKILNLNKAYNGIKLLGFIPNQELAKIYRSARLFIYPSLQEGFGLPVIEAMASGIPVLVPDTDHYRKITGGKTSYFNPKIKDDLFLKINKIISSEQNNSNALTWVNQYTWKDVAKKTLEVYKE